MYEEELRSTNSIDFNDMINNTITTLDKYNLKKKEMCLIGDQIVTDVICANSFRILSILVDPLGEKDLKITGINRKLEAKIIKFYKKRGLFERGTYYE